MSFVLSAFVFPCLIVLAGSSDVLSRRIPNVLALLIAASFLGAAVAAGMSLTDLARHFAAGLVLLVGGYLLFSFRLLGGGDAKFLAAAGLWFGFEALPMFLTMTVLAGGVLSLAVMAWSMVSLHHEMEGSSLHRLLKVVRPSVPYGYAIAAGAIMAFPESGWGGLA